MDDNEIDALLRAAFDRGADAPDLGADDALLALLGAMGPAIERLDATVSLVTDGDPVLVGVRSAAMLDDRQIVAEAGDVTIVLDVVRAGDGVLDVRGEVLGLAGPCAVQLLDGPVEVALTVTDGSQEFVLRAVPPGRYELILAAERREVSVSVELD